ncbi:MAG: hypothetical protein FJY83_03005 [Candidatus Aminicenantes bacterium]|nr:hypothetical protein [Candidatus Aminicenantes bacterium]
MKILKLLPTFFFLLVVLNILFIFGAAGGTELEGRLFSVAMVSKDLWVFTWGHLFLVVGLVCLFIELLKATRTSVASIYDHIMSTLTFILFLLEFLFIKGAGSSVFLMLTLMSLFDVVAGFTITITAARRDIALDRDASFIQPTP